VLVHGTPVSSPVQGKHSSTLAKALASDEALSILFDDTHPHRLAALCTCHNAMETDQRVEEVEYDRVDDETAAGFAAAARRKLEALKGDHGVIVDDDAEEGEIFDDI
jgi:hypothetical protein